MVILLMVNMYVVKENGVPGGLDHSSQRSNNENVFHFWSCQELLRLRETVYP